MLAGRAGPARLLLLARAQQAGLGLLYVCSARPRPRARHQHCQQAIS